MSEFVITGFSDEIDEKITKQFAHLNTLGISYFEPRGIDGVNIADIDAPKREKLKEEMKKHNIKVSSVGSPIGKIGIGDPFEPHMEKLKRVIETAHELDTKYIRVFSFFMPRSENPQNYRGEVIDRIGKMCDIAEKENVMLLHENEKEIYGDTAKRCLDILESVDSKALRAVFDPANFVQCGETTYPDAFEMLKPYIEYMHIKDAFSDGSVVPAGCGEGHVEEILSVLWQDGYEGFLSLEPHLGSFKGLEGLELDDKMLSLDGSTPEKFTLAYDSLKKITERVRG